MKMTEEELKKRIESSEDLRRVRATLVDEVAFRADGPARLDPFTILTIISIVIQIISYCRKTTDDAAIVNLIKNARTIPRRKTIRLRRRLGLVTDNADAVYAAIMDMAENADDIEINEIMRIAADCK